MEIPTGQGTGEGSLSDGGLVGSHFFGRQSDEFCQFGNNALVDIFPGKNARDVTAQRKLKRKRALLREWKETAMAGLRAVYLAPEDIEKIVAPLLERAFAAYGFRGQIIKEDEAYGGDPVIRVRADVSKAVPAQEQIETLSRIHDALRRQNDERLVFLSAPGPNAVSPEDHGDEDVD